MSVLAIGHPVFNKLGQILGEIKMMDSVNVITTSFPIKMVCECELLSNSNGEVHPYPEDGVIDVCTNTTYNKVEDKYGDYVWLCSECEEHNC